MGAVDDKGGGDKALHPLDRRHDLRLRHMVFRHMGGPQHRQAHAAGQVPGVYHRNVIKGFRGLKGVLVSHADVLCHGNMDYVLGLCQLFGEKPLIVLNLRRLGVPLPSLGNMGQQLVRLQLLAVQEAPLIRADIVGAHGNAKLLDEGFRQVAYAVRCHQDGTPFCLLENQDVLPQLRLPRILIQPHQLLGQNAENRRLQQRAAHRLGQVAAEPFLSVEKLVVAACVGSQGNHGHILAQSPRLHPQGVEALDPVHFRHHVVHQNTVVMVVLGQLQAFRPAGCGVNLNFCLRKQLGHHHQVHVVVVHHQDVGLGRLKALPVRPAVMELCPGGQRKRPQILIVHNVLLQRDDKL